METIDVVVPKATYHVKLSDVADLLCCGMEGGIGYWANIVDYERPAEFKQLIDGRQEDGTPVHIYRHIDYPINGGAVFLREVEEEDDSSPPWRLDLEALKRGLQTMAEKHPRHFNDFINDNADAITGDVFVQCCILGDIVYG